MHAYIHTYIHTYIHACMHACMHTTTGHWGGESQKQKQTISCWPSTQSLPGLSKLGVSDTCMEVRTGKCIYIYAWKHQKLRDLDNKWFTNLKSSAFSKYLPLIQFPSYQWRRSVVIFHPVAWLVTTEVFWRVSMGSLIFVTLVSNQVVW